MRLHGYLLHREVYTYTVQPSGHLVAQCMQRIHTCQWGCTNADSDVGPNTELLTEVYLLGLIRVLTTLRDVKEGPF